MNFLGIIPARYGSTRLEGKPLLNIAGKPMIQHVYERAMETLDPVYVATDDDRIYDKVKAFNGKVIMTSPDHNSGTNRCLEAYEIITRDTHQHYDVIINIQGDEPLLHREQLKTLMDCFTDEYIMMATLAYHTRDPEDLLSEDNAFVVFDKNLNALYFSRLPIPSLKGIPHSEWIIRHDYYKHVGIYAYTAEALEIFAGLQQTSLEKAEKLEQNRWLENGHAIKIGITEYPAMGVDTPGDLNKIRSMLAKE